VDGSFSPFTIQVNLSVSYPGLLSALTISGSNLPTAVVGKAYTPNDAGFSVTGGAGPYVWSIVSGSLPAALSLNTATGAIIGTPTTAGTSTFTAQVSDSSGPPFLLR
jgi:hypothetical protein